MAKYIERQEVCSKINELPLTEDAAMEILWAVDKIPTADVAPVVHGHWIHGGNSFVTFCSVCDYCFEEDMYDFDYCSNCGAKMDGDTT